MEMMIHKLLIGKYFLIIENMLGCGFSLRLYF